MSVRLAVRRRVVARWILHSQVPLFDIVIYAAGWCTQEPARAAAARELPDLGRRRERQVLLPRAGLPDRHLERHQGGSLGIRSSVHGNCSTECAGRLVIRKVLNRLNRIAGSGARQGQRPDVLGVKLQPVRDLVRQRPAPLGQRLQRQQARRHPGDRLSARHQQGVRTHLTARPRPLSLKVTSCSRLPACQGCTVHATIKTDKHGELTA